MSDIPGRCCRSRRNGCGSGRHGSSSLSFFPFKIGGGYHSIQLIDGRISSEGKREIGRRDPNLSNSRRSESVSSGWTAFIIAPVSRIACVIPFSRGVSESSSVSREGGSSPLLYSSKPFPPPRP